AMNAHFRWRPCSSRGAWLLLGVALCQAGCAAIRVDRAEGPTVTGSWRASALTCRALSPRSRQVLRRYDLDHFYPDRLAEACGKLHQEALRDPQPGTLFALAELNYLRGLEAESKRDSDACVFYYLAAGYAYHYLFDEPNTTDGAVQRVSGSAGPVAA